MILEILEKSKAPVSSWIPLVSSGITSIFYQVILEYPLNIFSLILRTSSPVFNIGDLPKISIEYLLRKSSYVYSRVLFFFCFQDTLPKFFRLFVWIASRIHPCLIPEIKNSLKSSSNEFFFLGFFPALHSRFNPTVLSNIS